VFNTGSAFSLGEGMGPLLSVLAVVIVVVLLRTGRTIEGTAPLVALGLVVGGAVGNLIDRAVRDGGGLLGGGVVDFVDLQWWPVFNLADVAICVGAVALALTFGSEGGPAAGGAP
jgi:signal peptidase II